MLNPFKHGRDTTERDAIRDDFEDKRAKAQAEYEARLQTLEAEENAAISTHDKEADANDPIKIQQRKHLEAMHAAKQRAARRLAALRRLADAEVKRKPPAGREMEQAMFDVSRFEDTPFVAYMKRE